MNAKSMNRAGQSCVGVGDDELDAAQAPPRQLAQKLAPEGLGFRGADVEAEHLAPASPLTPTATATATETMRPPRRTFR